MKRHSGGTTKKGNTEEHIFTDLLQLTFKLMSFRCDNQDTVRTVAYKVRRMDGKLVDATQSATAGYVVPQWFHQYRYSVQDYRPIHSNERFLTQCIRCRVDHVSAFRG